MAKAATKEDPQESCEYSLRMLRTHAELLGDYHQWRMCLVSSSIKTLGSILHRHLISEDFDFTDGDVEGIALTIEALGSFVCSISEDINNSSGYMLKKLDNLEGAK